MMPLLPRRPINHKIRSTKLKIHDDPEIVGGHTTQTLDEAP
jgi:hypothetical protein